MTSQGEGGGGDPEDGVSQCVASYSWVYTPEVDTAIIICNY